MTRNGVIETSSGDLLRWGYDVDFVNDGSFKPATETQRTDIPDSPLIRKTPTSTGWHSWNGTAWVVVSNPASDVPSFRILRRALVDQKVRSKILGGTHEWPTASGRLYSLSITSQLSKIGGEVKKAVLTYPKKIRTWDNGFEGSLASALDMTSFTDSAALAIEALLTAADSVKTDIDAATTIAGVASASDAYLAS